MSRIEELETEIKGLENRKIELLKELEVEKQKIEFEYPSLKIREMYWFINDEGLAFRTRWDEDRFDKRRCKIGNVFSTEEKAAKEVQKLSLLTRFRQFRDKCNGDWKPDWEVIEDSYNYYIEMYYGYGNAKLRTDWSPSSDSFNLFGYFKNKEDCDRAIELFGDEIKRLYLEG